MSTRLCGWEKTNGSPMNGSRIWLSAFEVCAFGRYPNATFREHCKSGIWRYPCVRSKTHPTQKSLALFEYLISVSSNEGDVILDPFIGSGTTAVACRKLNRNFIGFELDSDYYQTALDRLKEL